jgi:hypothetical protein
MPRPAFPPRASSSPSSRKPPFHSFSDATRSTHFALSYNILADCNVAAMPYYGVPPDVLRWNGGLQGGRSSRRALLLLLLPTCNAVTRQLLQARPGDRRVACRRVLPAGGGLLARRHGAAALHRALHLGAQRRRCGAVYKLHHEPAACLRTGVIGGSDSSCCCRGGRRCSSSSKRSRRLLVCVESGQIRLHQAPSHHAAVAICQARRRGNDTFEPQTPIQNVLYRAVYCPHRVSAAWGLLRFKQPESRQEKSCCCCCCCCCCVGGKGREARGTLWWR